MSQALDLRPEPELEWTKTLPGPVWRVTEPTVACAPDGQTLAVAMRSPPVVVVVDALAGNVLRQLEDHTDSVNAVAWSPDGRWLASVADDNTVRVWDPHHGSGREVHRTESTCQSVAWLPASERLVLGTTGFGLQTWSSREGAAELGEGPTDDVRCVAVSPGATHVALHAYRGTIDIRTVADGRLVAQFAHELSAYAVAWMDAWHVATGGGGELRIWDTRSGEVVRAFEIDESEVNSLSWEPAGKLLALATDGVVAVHDATGRALWSVDEAASTVVWSPDGHRLFEVDGDGRIRCWRFRDAPRAGDPDPVHRWAARQAEGVGRAATTRWVPQLDSAAGARLGHFDGERGESARVALSPSGRQLAVMRSSVEGSRVRIRDLHDGQVVREFGVPLGFVYDVAWSPDGRFLAGAGDGTTVVVLDPTQGQMFWQCAVDDTEVRDIAWSPDSRRLAFATRASIEVWELGASRPLRVYPTVSETLDWHPDGRWLASSDRDGSISIWADGEQPAMRTRGHDGQAHCVQWSADGERLASVGEDSTVRVWAFDTDGLSRHREFAGAGLCVRWSSNGRQLAIGHWDGSIRRYDAASGTELEAYGPEAASVWRMDWDPGGAFVVAEHGNGRVTLWDTRTSPLGSTRGHRSVPALLRPLPRAIGVLHRMGLHPPVSLVADWLAITADQPPSHHDALGPLRDIVRPLSRLRWPVAARVALLPIVLEPARSVAPDALDDPPPSGATPSRVRDALAAALSGESCPPRPFDVAAAPLQEAAERTLRGEQGARVLGLLNALGPEPFVADPTLGSRLRGELPSVPLLGDVHRRLLTGLLRGTREGRGQATGPGVGRTGLSRHGPLSTLLRSQLALPRCVVHLPRRVEHAGLPRPCSPRPSDLAPPRCRPGRLARHLGAGRTNSPTRCTRFGRRSAIVGITRSTAPSGRHPDRKRRPAPSRADRPQSASRRRLGLVAPRRNDGRRAVRWWARAHGAAADPCRTGA